MHKNTEKPMFRPKSMVLLSNDRTINSYVETHTLASDNE